MSRLPGERTILWFRHSLEAHGLGQQILAIVNTKLIDPGLMLKTGTVVDAYRGVEKREEIQKQPPDSGLANCHDDRQAQNAKQNQSQPRVV